MKPRYFLIVLFVLLSIVVHFSFTNSYAEELDITSRIKIQHAVEERGFESGEDPNEVNYYWVTFNDEVKVYYDTTNKRILVNTTITNQNIPGIYRIIVDDIKSDSSDDNMLIDTLDFTSTNHNTITIPYSVENFNDVIEFSIRISPPSTSANPDLLLDKIDVFIPKLTMDYLFDKSIISNNQIPYSIMTRENYALLTIDNAKYFTR